MAAASWWTNSQWIMILIFWDSINLKCSNIKELRGITNLTFFSKRVTLHSCFSELQVKTRAHLSSLHSERTGSALWPWFRLRRSFELSAVGHLCAKASKLPQMLSLWAQIERDSPTERTPLNDLMGTRVEEEELHRGGLLNRVKWQE